MTAPRYRIFALVTLGSTFYHLDLITLLEKTDIDKVCAGAPPKIDVIRCDCKVGKGIILGINFLIHFSSSFH